MSDTARVIKLEDSVPEMVACTKVVKSEHVSEGYVLFLEEENTLLCNDKDVEALVAAMETAMKAEKSNE